MNINIKKRIILASLALVALIFLFILFIISPLFRQIKAESQKLIIQKKEIFESDLKIKNIHNFVDNFKQYQPNLDKINNLFINISEPVEFIKFLEEEAENSKLSIEITPPALKKNEGDTWQSFDFGLSLRGSFINFLRFFERIDSSPYLIETLNLTVRDDPDDKKSGIVANLSIKVYTK